MSGQSDNDHKDLVTKPTPTKPSSGGETFSFSSQHQQNKDNKIKIVKNSKNYFMALFKKFQSYNLGKDVLKAEINSGKDFKEIRTSD